ncbi:Neprilysin-1 [Nymphon striatum]|nr:Neprilysin-1 [Nymphon striatum]
MLLKYYDQQIVYFNKTSMKLCKFTNLPLCLKRKVYDQCILPVLTYGSETWAITDTLLRKLASAQHSMERRILGVSWRDRKTNSLRYPRYPLIYNKKRLLKSVHHEHRNTKIPLHIVVINLPIPRNLQIACPICKLRMRKCRKNAENAENFTFFDQPRSDQPRSEQVTEIAENVRTSFQDVIKQSDWIDEEILYIFFYSCFQMDSMKFSIGYPDIIKNDEELDRIYSSIDIKPNNIIYNLFQLRTFIPEEHLSDGSRTIFTRIIVIYTINQCYKGVVWSHIIMLLMKIESISCFLIILNVLRYYGRYSTDIRGHKNGINTCVEMCYKTINLLTDKRNLTSFDKMYALHFREKQVERETVFLTSLPAEGASFGSRMDEVPTSSVAFPYTIY